MSLNLRGRFLLWRERLLRPRPMQAGGQQERRCGLFEVRRDRRDNTRYHIVRRSDGKCFGHTSSLRRATDTALNHERNVEGLQPVQEEWQLRLQRINDLIEERKRQRALGANIVTEV